MQPPAPFRFLNTGKTITIPWTHHNDFCESLSYAAARIDHHTTIGDDCKNMMIPHFKLVYDQHVLENMHANTLLRDLNPDLFMDRQQALHWDSAFPQDSFHFYVDSKTTKVYSTIWHGMKCIQRPLEDLQPIEGGDLAMNRTHEDRMIIGKVITPVKSGLCLSFYIEDPSGATFPVLINYPTPIPHFSLSLAQTLANLYPLGSILAIKSPRIGFNANGGYAIKVNMPQEIEELRPNDTLLREVKWKVGLKEESPKGWMTYRRQGSEAMGKQNPLVALRFYSLGLSDPDVKNTPFKTFALLLERAEVYDTLHLHGYAYRDAHRARESIENNDIPLTPGQNDRLCLRLAKAALGLRLYKTALQAFEQASPRSFLSLELKKVREKVEMRMNEKQSGAYDWLAIFRESLEAGSLVELDIPDYTSPACKVDQIPGSGRGVLATRDIIPGELIMVSKAIAPSRTQLDAPNVYINCYDAESKSHVYHTTYMWVYRLLHRIYDDPSLVTVLEGFSSSGKVPSPEQLPQFEDEDARLKLIFATVPSDLSLNTFRQISKTNAFGGWSVPARGAGFDKGVNDEAALKISKEVGVCLHGMPALINHSCWPNMTGCWYGDMMILRASKHISAGDQLFMSYNRDEPSYTRRQPTLVNWDFECTCYLCQADTRPQEDPDTRAELTKKNVSLLFSNPSEAGSQWTVASRAKHLRDAERLEGLVVEMGNTYAPGRPQRTKGELARIYSRLGRSYFLAAEPVKTEAAILNFLTCAGVSLTTREQERRIGRKLYESHYLEDEVILGMIMLAVVKGAKDMLQANKWAQAALWIHNVRYGGGVALFNERYNDHLLSHFPVKFDLGE
ncbi:hypothetical protein L202_02595 [Cryptococcus amylolentus CBS 6039]|uniref:SET domain-containing protein n=1 Tax=Cryptococcus amylolentus CBS 6039 TaxID=1295533 RepID=A0A1E3HVZ9_9TREE|nr:hypothetical protein L202_02595 [Cryptococcus amylolentus CBS 6039]ODN80335.1 hypothetical protein L202_02595 [Cryptococcus amylolentus CBS 6039]